MATIHITKGHNLVLAGSPEKSLNKLDAPKSLDEVDPEILEEFEKLGIKILESISLNPLY